MTQIFKHYPIFNQTKINVTITLLSSMTLTTPPESSIAMIFSFLLNTVPLDKQTWQYFAILVLLTYLKNTQNTNFTIPKMRFKLFALYRKCALNSVFILKMRLKIALYIIYIVMFCATKSGHFS